MGTGSVWRSSHGPNAPEGTAAHMVLMGRPSPSGMRGLVARANNVWMQIQGLGQGQ